MNIILLSIIVVAMTGLLGVVMPTPSPQCVERKQSRHES